MTIDAKPLIDLLSWWLTLTVTAWLLVAVAAGWLAAEKGRSPVIWFLVGLVGSAFAVLLVGFAPRGASGAYRRCRACREPVRRDAEVCPFCQTGSPTDPLA